MIGELSRRIVVDAKCSPCLCSVYQLWVVSVCRQPPCRGKLQAGWLSRVRPEEMDLLRQRLETCLEWVSLQPQRGAWRRDVIPDPGWGHLETYLSLVTPTGDGSPDPELSVIS